MMRARLIGIAERRALLRLRAEKEREALAAFAERAEGAASLIAAARGVLEHAARRPLVVAAAVALFVGLKPRRLLGLAARGWSLWRLYRSGRRWWALLAPAATSARGRN